VVALFWLTGFWLTELFLTIFPVINQVNSNSG